MDYEKTSNAIRTARIAAGYTQAQAAGLLGKSQTTVAAWETGRAMPPAPMIIELAKLYGVSSDYLLGLSDYYSDTHEKVIKALFGGTQAPSFSNEVTKIIATLSEISEELGTQDSIVDESITCITEAMQEFNKLLSCFILYYRVIWIYDSSFAPLVRKLIKLQPDGFEFSEKELSIIAKIEEYENRIEEYDPAGFEAFETDSISIIRSVEGSLSKLALLLQHRLNDAHKDFIGTANKE